MWAEACARLDEAERRHRQFFELLGGAARPAWEPPADVFAEGADWHIRIALPGAHGEQVEVRLGDSGVQIEALVPPPRVGSRAQVWRLELPYGRMWRRIDLPPGRYRLIERRLEHGCLYLRLQGVPTP